MLVSPNSQGEMLTPQVMEPLGGASMDGGVVLSAWQSSGSHLTREGMARALGDPGGRPPRTCWCLEFGPCRAVRSKCLSLRHPGPSPSEQPGARGPRGGHRAGPEYSGRDGSGDPGSPAQRPDTDHAFYWNSGTRTRFPGQPGRHPRLDSVCLIM